MAYTNTKKYEEIAYIINFSPRSSSKLIPGRDGPLIEAIGENRLILLETLAAKNSNFTIGQKIYIGKEGRTDVVSVLGRLSYQQLSEMAKNSLQQVIELLVQNNESKFLNYFNELQPIGPRLHSLELIPGVGKTTMQLILKEREKSAFKSFEDLKTRVGIKEPIIQLSKRIHEEIIGNTRLSIFIRK